MTRRSATQKVRRGRSVDVGSALPQRLACRDEAKPVNAISAAASLLSNASPEELAAAASAAQPSLGPHSVPVAQLTTADALADPGLADKLETVSRLALDKLEDILLMPCGPDDAQLRRDQLAAAQVILSTQVRVDENKLKAHAIKPEHKDWFAISQQMRREHPHLYRRRAAEKKADGEGE